MTYIISKTIGGFTYYLSTGKYSPARARNIHWNGLVDNAKRFTSKDEAHSFCMLHQDVCFKSEIIKLEK